MTALARAYVDALDEGSLRRGRLFAVECALDDDLRPRDGRPSNEEEILADLEGH